MHIISNAQQDGNTYVLTMGNVASLTGNMVHDLAVYCAKGNVEASKVARGGLKLTHRQALAVGYDIAVENYRR